MKKIVPLFLLFLPLFAVAQIDVVKLHNGKTLDVKVIRSTDEQIVFVYENETAEQSIGKYSVESITYGQSGRVESVSDLITVSSKSDWEKVVILTEKESISGLKPHGEIKGKTGFINYHTANTGDKKAEKKIKEAAAAMGCPFIYLTSEKDTNYTGFGGKGFGNIQNVKKGVAYNYQ